MKTLLGVLAATIRGSLTLPRQTPHGLEGTSQLGDVTDPQRQSTKFSCHGVSPRS